MTFWKLLRAATIAAASLLLAAPMSAQTAGPLRTVSIDPTRLSVTPPRLAAPIEMRADAAPVIDPGAELAGQIELSKPHIYKSAPLSALLGVAGTAAGLAAGYVLLDCEDEGSSCGHGPDDGEYFAAAAGLALGSAAGAHWGGLRRDSRGSFGLTLLGAAAGAIPSLLVATGGEQLEAGWGVSLAAAPVGAVLVDHLVRRPRR